MKVILLVEDYTVAYEQELKITVFSEYGSAQHAYWEACGRDRANHPELVVTYTDNHYENYETGNYAEEHSVIYIEEKEVL